MKKRKRILSLFLALLIALSGLTVGFSALAAEAAEKSDSKVTAVQESIQNWYDNHRNNLYATKAEQQEAKDAARKAFDATSKLVSELSETQKLQLDSVFYTYWLTVVQNDVARTDPAKTPTVQQKIDTLKELTGIEAVMGKIPASYVKVIDGFAPYNEACGTIYLANTSKLNFKGNDALQKALADLIANVKGFNESQLAFSDYIALNTTGGFYFNKTNLNSGYGTTLKNVLKYMFLEQQDLNTASGESPKSFSTYTYVERKGTSAAGYTYSFKSGKTAEGYVKDFNDIVNATQTDLVDQCAAVMPKFLDVVESIDDFEGIKDAVLSISEVGKKVVHNENPTVAEVNSALDKYNNLSDNGKRLFDSIATSTDYIVTYIAENIYTADSLTAELAYTKASKITTYKLSDMKSKLNDVLYALMLEEFVAYVEGTDLNKVTDTVVKTAKEKYVALPSSFRKQISDETFAKFTQIVKPASDPYNFAKEVKAFKTTNIVRPADSDVAMTVGGIQSAVDKLWELVAFTVVPLISSDIDLADGLDTVLEENVYTNEMVSNILDLYATLSRNDLDLGVMGFTLGKVVNMLLTPNNIAKALEEEKFAVAAEKIKAFQSFEETEEKNKLEALAEVNFADGDFGFEDGDREGFVDALLAILRPITSLLAPGAKALGLISLDIKMFDYLDDDGNYVEGVYSNLVPMLEQLGMTSLPTTEDYKANYYNVVEKSGTNIAADELLRPVIDSLLKDVLDLVSPDPLNGIIKVLPRVAYIIGTDMVNDSVKAALAQMGMLSGLAGSLDLSRKAIDKMLAEPIDLTDVVGKEFKLQLKPVDWMKLANCATVESVQSHSNSNDYFILRTGDTDSCFTTLFYYIYDVAFADKANYAQIKGLINSALGGTIGMIVTGITDDLVSAGNVGAYGMLLDMLGTPGDTPIAPDNNDKKPDNNDKKDETQNNIKDKVDQLIPGALDKNDNDDKSNTNKINKNKLLKNPLIPKTGGEKTAYIMTAVYAALALAIACAYVVYKRKSAQQMSE